MGDNETVKIVKRKNLQSILKKIYLRIFFH
jgi:hypothetical protein